MKANPYQDVIDWLRSPEGENWSEQRMRKARTLTTRIGPSRELATLTAYGVRGGPLFLGGVLSVKDG